jgi:predicted ATPase
LHGRTSPAARPRLPCARRTSHAGRRGIPSGIAWRGASALVPNFELRAAVSLAGLWAEQGRRDEAHDLLAPVCGWFTEGLATKDLVAAKTLLGEL